MPNEIIEVFRTNVISENIADNIIKEIKTFFPDINVNFDLEDCDNILRMVAPTYQDIYNASMIVINYGYICEVLPD